MNRRLVTILLFACVIAGGCALLVFRLVGTRLQAAKPVLTTKVVGASHDLQIGSLISPNDLTTVSIAGGAPKDAITDPKLAVGRGVVSEIYQGEPVLQSRLAQPGSGAGLAATIPQGMRACAIRVDEVVGVAGFVLPGMRVDVLASGDPFGGNQASTMTKTILQNIQVLSAGTDIQKDAEGKPKQVQVVNLLVTPEQAEQLSLASNQLKIQLVLRNPLDTKIAEVPTTAIGSMFGGAPAARAVRTGARPARPAYSMVIQNGAATSTEKFSTAGGEK